MGFVRRFVVGFVVVASLAIVRAQQTARPPGSSTARTRTLHGRVVADDNGNAVPNARIILESSGNQVSTTSDREGRFTLTAPGTNAMVSASKAGYATARVTAGDSTEIRLPRGAAILGHVTDDGGGPLPLMIVVAERRRVVDGRVRFERQTTAETDDTGSYRLFDLPAGDYVIGRSGPRVILTAPGRIPVPTAVEESPRDYYPHTTRPEEAQVLSLTAGSEAAGIDFTVPVPPLFYRPVQQPVARRDKLGTIRGRVLRADGRPVRGARVEASSAERLFSPHSAATDDNGQYELTDLPAGDYLVEATDAQFGAARFGQLRPADRGTIIALTAGQVADRIDVSMPRSGAIVGRVLDEYGDPLEKVTLVAQQLRWSAGRLRLAPVRGAPYTRSDDRGRFRLFALPPGRFVVRADFSTTTTANDRPRDASDYAPTFFPGTTIANEARPVELAADNDTLNVDFALARGGTAQIRGRVLRADGQPFDGKVHLVASHRSHAIADLAPARTTADDGYFAFGDLAPGEYVIQAATSREGASREGELGLTFVTAAGTDVGEITVRMSTGSSVTGRITFDGGAPPSSGSIELSPVAADLNFVSLADNPVARADIHDDWSFEMHGLNGPRRLTLLRAPDGWMLERVLLHGADITDAAVPFGSPTQSASDVEVVLTSRVPEIAGRVADERGRPWPDASIVVFSTQPALWYRQSRFVKAADAGGQGRFTVRALPPGDYFVAALDKREIADVNEELDNPALLQRLTSGASRVTLTDGQHAAVDLLLRSRPR